MTQSPPTSPSATSRPPSPLATFLDLIKFAHSIFALPFALIATFWAFRQLAISPFAAPGLGRLALILVCMVLARTFAMTVNRLVDRHYDALNPRTARRPSVTGHVSERFMRITIAFCIILFVAATELFDLFFHNPYPLYFALPVLAWLAIYSYTKRFTSLCHFWLGISLGLAPVSAWIAIAYGSSTAATVTTLPATTPSSSLDLRLLTILLLGGGVALWVAGFDILYALQDEQFDRDHHLNSLPARLGRKNALHASRLCHLLTIFAFLALGHLGHFHTLYWIGFALAALLLLIEQSLISEKDISKINLAFMTANGLIGLTFGALAIADTLLT